MRETIEQLRDHDNDSGVALPFVAIMLVLLIGMTALAVDLGWLYLNGSRVQRGADAAALAGVVHLPANVPQVDAQTVNGANANGWHIGELNGAGIVGGGPDSLDWQPLSENRLQVEVTATVPTFFLRVFGIDDITMTRQATAEYVKPVPLGSPGNCFGIGPGVGTAGLLASASGSWAKCGTFVQNFWAAMNGRRTALEHGDPFGTECTTATSGGSCNGFNPDYDPFYWYAIEMPAGRNFMDVYLYDAGFYHRPGFAETGDSNLNQSTLGGTHMNFALFRPAVAADPLNNLTPVGCANGTNNLTVNAGAAGHQNQWNRMCRVNNPAEGLYVLRVTNSGNIGGTNSYSLLVSTNDVTATSTTFPRVYALNYMGIFANANNATVYIADVEPIHAGKTLILEFFDPGEGAGTATMTVTPPPGVSAPSCSWTATNGQSGSSCQITTTVGGVAQFNNHWITMQIKLPGQENYNCTTDCFWRMAMALNTAHDRTTWTARVIGNPVRLVPNEP